jgi:hypothetical protein
MRDSKPLSKTAATESPVEGKRLHGVLKRGPNSFAMRVTVPDANDQAHIHHPPFTYASGMDAALAYDSICRLLLPYRPRPSPLNFPKRILGLDALKPLAAYFQTHLLPFLPHMKVPVEDVVQAKSKMKIQQAQAFFAARRKDGPVHPYCCCRWTWFKRSVHKLTQEFEEKVSTKLRVPLTDTTDHEGVRRLCNSCCISF